MELTKKNLISATVHKLVELGYTKFEDGFFGSDGLFVKCVSEGFFLSLGLTISKTYATMFTGTYYLSKSTRWGSLWGDIPQASYKRVGSFLTSEERNQLLSDKFKIEGVKDAWWAADSRGINNFITAVSLTEERFIAQPNLITDIEKSVEVNMLAEYSSSVIDLVKSGKEVKQNYSFIPAKSINNIPIEWFKASEITIDQYRSILNINTVRLLAADAWKINMIKTKRQVD